MAQKNNFLNTQQEQKEFWLNVETGVGCSFIGCHT